jgi:hypothetical protein
VVDLGQTVAASLQTPTLIKIAQDLSEMRIDSSFAEADIGSIREGQKVRFTVDAFPNRSFQGQVQQIRLNPTTQQNVVTYNVRVSLSNPEQILLPGMTAYVSIGVASREDACWCPTRRCVSSPARPTAAVAATSRPAVRRQRRPERDEWQRRRRRGEGQGQEARHRQRHGLRDRPGRAEAGECAARDHRQPQYGGARRRAEGRRQGRHRREHCQQQRQAEQRRDEIVLMAEAIIRVAGLGKSYLTAAGPFPALRGVDLEIEPANSSPSWGPRGPASRPS